MTKVTSYFPVNRFNLDPYLRELAASSERIQMGRTNAFKERIHSGDYIVLLLCDEEGLELHAPTADHANWTDALRTMKETLQCLPELDNLVQQSCEQDWKKSENSPDSYMLHLAWFKVTPCRLTLGYWGTKVNTQWEAIFDKQPDGSWSAVNF
jgi:hypothetical protein